MVSIRANLDIRHILFTNHMTFGLLVFLILGVRHPDSQLSSYWESDFRTPSCPHIGSQTFGLLVVLILGVRLSDSQFFRLIGSPTFGLLDTANTKSIYFQISKQDYGFSCNNYNCNYTWDCFNCAFLTEVLISISSKNSPLGQLLYTYYMINSHEILFHVYCGQCKIDC